MKGFLDALGWLLVAGACITMSAAIGQTDRPRTGAPKALLASADGTVSVQTIASATVSRSEADRGVQTCIDMTEIDSWDSLNDSDNIVIDLDISADMKVTGLAWDIGLATVGDSWVADASLLLSNSDGFADPNANILAPGFEVAQPGDREFTSDGVVLFEDVGLADVEPNPDGIIRLQFFEDFDDLPDAIDARWRNAAEPVTCPGIWLELAEFIPPENPGPSPAPEPDPNPVPLGGPVTLGLLIALLGIAAFVTLRSRAAGHAGRHSRKT